MQKYDLPILFGIYLLLVLFAFVITPGIIQVWEACILFSLTIIYTIFLILREKKENNFYFYCNHSSCSDCSVFRV